MFCQITRSNVSIECPKLQWLLAFLYVSYHISVEARTKFLPTDIKSGMSAKGYNEKVLKNIKRKEKVVYY